MPLLKKQLRGTVHWISCKKKLYIVNKKSADMAKEMNYILTRGRACCSVANLQSREHLLRCANEGCKLWILFLKSILY